jgi:hypothetical protein
MTKRREILGTGITKRELTLHSDEDLGPFIKGFASRWNAAASEGGRLFGAVVLGEEHACLRILACTNLSRPFDADSAEDYAQRTLHLIRVVKAAIARGQADSAARWAVEVGRLRTEAEMKGLWEPHAERGEKNVRTLTESAHRANKKRKLAGDQRHAKWQARADEIRSRKPQLSASAVAQRIVREAGGNYNTIRRSIRKK